nr:putative ribonuclease H-like domain-containing protein [Tanacetum cinerariifolium]
VSSFLLLEYIPTVRLSVPTAVVYIAKKLATVEDFSLLHEDKIYSESKTREVIEFGDSYKAPIEETAKDKGPAGEVSSSTKKKGRTMAITAKDMQKRKNDVKVRTTLLLALPNEHQLRFNKYDSAKELWEAILKTYGGNEATKKTKNNQLKQQYGNFKAEGSETLEQTFSRLQDIVSHLEFMDVSLEQDDLNQKFLTSLAPEWLVYTIVWRNRDDLDTMSLDDMYNHLKVYEAKKKTSKKITIQGSDVAGFDKSKVECFNCHKMVHFAREFRSPRSQDRGNRESYKKDPNVEEPAPKAMIAIDGIRWYWSYMDEKDKALKNHALVADEEEVPTEYALMAKSSSSSDNEVYDDFFCSKSCRKNTKNLDTKISKLNEELSDRETDLYNYKREFNCNHNTWVDKGKTWTRVNHAQDNMKFTSTHKSMTPRAVLLKSSTKPINKPFSTARPTLKSAQPKMTSFVKTVYSNVKRPFERKSAAKNKVWSPTVRPKIPTVGSKVPTAKPTVVADKGNKGKAVKAATRWIWKPKQTSYGKDFKLVDDKHVLLRTPRQQNMYTIDLKNVVSHKNLTCLIAKASVDESMLWHRRESSIRLLTVFLKSKDETSRIIRNFIKEIENLKDPKVKIIRSDNRGEFKNKEMDEFCSKKGIKREFSNARTPQQNGVAERRNMTLIEAARTMLSDAKLLVTF